MMKTGCTWEGLGQTLHITTAMLSMIKTGKRNPSKKLLFRLEEAERQAGILPPVPVITEPVYLPETALIKKVKISGKGGVTTARDERIAGAIAVIRSGLDELEQALKSK